MMSPAEYAALMSKLEGMTSLELAKKAALLTQMKQLHTAKAEMCGAVLAHVSLVANRKITKDNLVNVRLIGSTFADGKERIVTPDISYKPSVTNSEKLHEWLRAQPSVEPGKTLGDVMIKESVHYSTLEAYINKQKEANQPVPPPDIVNIFTVESVSVRRAPTKSK